MPPGSSPTRRSSSVSTGRVRRRRCCSSTKRSARWPTTAPAGATSSPASPAPSTRCCAARQWSGPPSSSSSSRRSTLDPTRCWSRRCAGGRRGASRPAVAPIWSSAGRRGRESRRVIVDFKSGGHSPVHRDDLRFYALIETLVHDVPPRRLVTYYLDDAECEVEEVTIGVLRAALRTDARRHRHPRRPHGRRPGATTTDRRRLPVVSAGRRLRRREVVPPWRR